MADSINNFYDDKHFYEGYKEIRDSDTNDNDLIEIPTIKAMLPNVKDKTILDLGCGAGGMCRYFIEKGAKSVLGVDISTKMINEAKSFTANNIDYMVMPMENISSITQKFDVVFSSLAFHYVKDFDKLMKDVSNLLKPGGILLFSQEHPLLSAAIRPMNVDKYINIKGKRYYLLSDYNDVSERKNIWLDTIVTKYHRNFETIINSIIKYNMQISEIREPAASKEAITKKPKLIYQKDRPMYLFVKVQKM